jgi:hypothetical protein
MAPSKTGRRSGRATSRPRRFLPVVVCRASMGAPDHRESRSCEGISVALAAVAWLATPS